MVPLGTSRPSSPLSAFLYKLIVLEQWSGDLAGYHDILPLGISEVQQDPRPIDPSGRDRRAGPGLAHLP